MKNCYSYDPVFLRTPNDNERSLSEDDREFIQIMDKSMHKDKGGHWKAPLPFKQPRHRLPNNRDVALRWARNLHLSLCRSLKKKQLLVEFMSKIIDKGHAEIAPPLLPTEEFWYIPILALTHHRKPDQVLGVFDFSVQHLGVSLNSVLLFSCLDLISITVYLEFCLDSVKN